MTLASVCCFGNDLTAVHTIDGAGMFGPDGECLTSIMLSAGVVRL